MFKEYYNPLCNFVNSMLKDRNAAEDIVQGVFIKIWKGLDRIQLKGSIKSYLMQSARNATIDHIRKNHVKLESFDGVDIPSDETVTESMSSDIENYQLREKIMAAIEQLKPKTQEIFKLHKIEGLTYPEIADYLKIPQRTVEYNIYTAIKQLKVILEKTLKPHEY